jgi:hypothetical protein
MPLVMVIRRIRRGACSPRLLGRRAWALQSANFWLFLALLAAAGLSGTFSVWRIYAPGAQAFIVGAFWVGLAAATVLVAFPRRRISPTANVLAVLGSIFLAVSLVGTVSGPPRDVVRIGVPFTDQWEVASGGGARSRLEAPVPRPVHGRIRRRPVLSAGRPHKPVRTRSLKPQVRRRGRVLKPNRVVATATPEAQLLRRAARIRRSARRPDLE